MKLLLYCTKSYCTKSKLYLYKRFEWEFEWDCFSKDKADKFYLGDCIEINDELNGKVVAECDFEVEKIVYDLRMTRTRRLFEEYTTKSLSEKELLNKSCLDMWQMEEYFNGKNGYAIHIKNLKVFGKPRELNYYCQLDKKALKESEYEVKEITKAPQNMMYCEDGLETKIIISIRPEWLCKILNGEKTFATYICNNGEVWNYENQSN